MSPGNVAMGREDGEQLKERSWAAAKVGDLASTANGPQNADVSKIWWSLHVTRRGSGTGAAFAVQPVLALWGTRPGQDPEPSNGFHLRQAPATVAANTHSIQTGGNFPVHSRSQSLWLRKVWGNIWRPWIGIQNLLHQALPRRTTSFAPWEADFHPHMLRRLWSPLAARRNVSTMATPTKVPAEPLLVILGSTGTGKSEVRAHGAAGMRRHRLTGCS